MKLHIDEIIELVTCALNKTGRLRPFNRIRLRVCEHLIGKGLMEPVKPGDAANIASYPVIIPSLRPGASVKLTQAGRDAVCELPPDDYGFWFPTIADVLKAKANCDCPEYAPVEASIEIDLDHKIVEPRGRTVHISHPARSLMSRVLAAGGEMPGNSSVRGMGERDK